MGLSFLGDFASGTLLTIEVTVLSFLGALVIGITAVVMRISPLAPLRIAGACYVECVRNIPVLALLFIFVFGLPQIGVLVPLLWSAVIVLACYEGAFACEALRVGVNNVDVGSAEAARALGLTTGKTLRWVILPQAVRSVIQPLANVFIKTAINSSLVAIIGLTDLTGVAQRINIREAQPMLFVYSGLVYLLLAVFGGQLAGYLERKLRFTR